MPKKTKFRKSHKGRRRNQGIASSKTSLSFGKYGLKALEHAWITSRQIESVRITVARAVQKGGRLWIRIFPDKPVTQKGNEMPMGGGKGAVDHYVVAVKPGTVLFEVDGIPAEVAREVLELAAYKLPIKSKFITKAYRYEV